MRRDRWFAPHGKNGSGKDKYKDDNNQGLHTASILLLNRKINRPDEGSLVPHEKPRHRPQKRRFPMQGMRTAGFGGIRRRKIGWRATLKLRRNGFARCIRVGRFLSWPVLKTGRGGFDDRTLDRRLGRRRCFSDEFERFFILIGLTSGHEAMPRGKRQTLLGMV